MKWITITPAGHSASGKTRVWIVASKDGGTLGHVHWYAAWRKYVFAPGIGSEYEQDCLRDISSFLEQATREHYENLDAKASVK